MLAAAGCIRLGIWQLDRLEQRRARNRVIAERRSAPPVVLDALGALPADPEHRRAAARGIFDFQREIVVTTRSVRSTPAVYVVTPLLLEDGLAVLVERGWVPSPDGMTVELEVLREADSAVVEGVLMPPVAADLPAAVEWPLRVRSLDPGTLVDRYPYQLVPAVLRRTVQPDALPAGLGAIPIPDLSDGPHLSYALQWFAFGTIAVVGSGVLFLRLGGFGREEPPRTPDG